LAITYGELGCLRFINSRRWSGITECYQVKLNEEKCKNISPWCYAEQITVVVQYVITEQWYQGKCTFFGPNEATC
ncbi:hypothetical protein T01_3173, partial [Trichinella spiralis]